MTSPYSRGSSTRATLQRKLSKQGLLENQRKEQKQSQRKVSLLRKNVSPFGTIWKKKSKRYASMEDNENDDPLKADTDCHQNHVDSSVCNTSTSTTTTTTGAASTSCSHEHHVAFGTIQIREYDRALGDVSDVPYGLGLGWNYYEHDPITIHKTKDETEQRSTDKRKQMRNNMQRSSSFKLMNRLWKSTKNTRQTFPTPKLSRQSSLQSFQRHGSNPFRERESSYNIEKTTVEERSQILQDFGFTENELAIAEQTRERIRFENCLQTYSSF